MKLLVIFALICAAGLALADERPIYEFAEWWAIRDMQPTQWIQGRLRSARIVGGQEATPNQFPYQVGLRLSIVDSANIGLCGGSLVSANRVVTAAHCVDIVSSVVTVFGAHFLNRDEATQVRQTVPLSGLIWHENYNPQTLTNDVAIINLPAPVSFNPVIQPVALPDGAELNDDFAGQSAVASGWGRFSSAQISSEFLRFVNVEVMTNNACRIRFPTIIQTSTICTSGTGGIGACNGDSGGPLTVQRNGRSLLIGIASFVSGVGCEGGWPTGFARVSSFVPWIRARL